MAYSPLQTALRSKNFKFQAGESATFHIQIDPFLANDQLRMVTYDEHFGSRNVLSAHQVGYLSGYVEVTLPKNMLNYSHYTYELQKQGENESDNWKVVAQGNIRSDRPRFREV